MPNQNIEILPQLARSIQKLDQTCADYKIVITNFDLPCYLGVMFSLNHEDEKAKECFRVSQLCCIESAICHLNRKIGTKEFCFETELMRIENFQNMRTTIGKKTKAVEERILAINTLLGNLLYHVAGNKQMHDLAQKFDLKLNLPTLSWEATESIKTFCTLYNRLSQQINGTDSETSHVLKLESPSTLLESLIPEKQKEPVKEPDTIGVETPEKQKQPVKEPETNYVVVPEKQKEPVKEPETIGVETPKKQKEPVKEPETNYVETPEKQKEPVKEPETNSLENAIQTLMASTGEDNHIQLKQNTCLFLQQLFVFMAKYNQSNACYTHDHCSRANELFIYYRAWIICNTPEQKRIDLYNNKAIKLFFMLCPALSVAYASFLKDSLLPFAIEVDKCMKQIQDDSVSTGAYNLMKQLAQQYKTLLGKMPV